jgi:hypothetical protein
LNSAQKQQALQKQVLVLQQLALAQLVQLPQERPLRVELLEVQLELRPQEEPPVEPLELLQLVQPPALRPNHFQ